MNNLLKSRPFLEKMINQRIRFYQAKIDSLNGALKELESIDQIAKSLPPVEMKATPAPEGGIQLEIEVPETEKVFNVRDALIEAGSTAKPLPVLPALQQVKTEESIQKEEQKKAGIAETLREYVLQILAARKGKLTIREIGEIINRDYKFEYNHGSLTSVVSILRAEGEIQMEKIGVSGYYFIEKQAEPELNGAEIYTPGKDLFFGN